MQSIPSYNFMKIPFFDASRQFNLIQQEVENAISRVCQSGWYISGEEVEKFEAAFKEYTVAKHCVGCANGTDALELALQALGIGAGDEVIVPAFGWISPALAVQRVGAMPIFADVGTSTFNIGLQQIAPLVTPRTKAVIVIHLFGLPCDIVGISAFCKSNSIKLIEDCAQAHGARVGGQHVGTLGQVGTFSFYPTKNLGAFGDAGCVVTNNADVAHKVCALANYGKVDGGFSVHGRNSRLDPIQAAILGVKLGKLDAWNSRRLDIAVRYTDALSDVGLVLPIYNDGRTYHQYVVAHANRDLIMQGLAEYGIGTLIHYPFVLPCQGVFGCQPFENFPNSFRLSQTVFSLPIFPELRDEEVDFVILTIKSVIENIKTSNLR